MRLLDQRILIKKPNNFISNKFVSVIGKISVLISKKQRILLDGNKQNTDRLIVLMELADM